MVGTTLSHYKITNELGRGGMGIVYKAEDTKLDRIVAIKVLPSAALATADDRERFYREAKAAAQLHHPHIASVFEIDEAVSSDAPHGTEPSPFIAMEFIDGGTLKEEIEKGPMKLREAVRISAQAGEALKLAHSKDIVHRDIKSYNVMLTKDGDAKVLDFGLAKTAQSTMLTRMGSTLGTVAYMSPEQARGDEVDHRTDIWSLGVTLFEMVAGRLPFAGEYEKAVIYGVLNEMPPPLTSLRTGVPMGLEWIVSKCLAKDPAERYQSCADLIVDLKTVDLSASGLSRQSSSAVSIASVQSAPMSATSDRLPAWIWGVVITAILGGFGLGYLTAGDDSADVETTQFSINLPAAVNPLRAAWTPDGRHIYYVARDSVESPTHVRTYSLSTGETQTIAGTDDANSVHISPDGRWLVFHDAEAQHFERMSTSGGQPTVIPGTDTPIWAGAMNDSGEFFFTTAAFDLAGVSESGVYREVASNDTTSHFFVGPVPVPGSTGLYWTAGVAAFAPHAGSYALTGPDRIPEHVLPQYAVSALSSNGFALLNPAGVLGEPVAIAPFDAESGRLLGVPIPFETMQFLALSKKGHLLYQPQAQGAGTGLRAMYRIQPGGEPIRLNGLPERTDNFGAAWSRNAVVFETELDGGRSDIFLLDLDSGTQTRLTRDGFNEEPSVSPDDIYVYFGRSIGDERGSIARKRLDGSGEIETVIADSFFNSNPIVSPDGRTIAYISDRDRTHSDLYGYRIDSGESFVISNDEDLQSDVRFSPDGRYVVYFSGETVPEGPLIVKSLEDGGEVEIVSSGGLPIWSSDGRYIYYRRGGDVFRVEVTTVPVFTSLGTEELIYSGTQHIHFDLLVDGSLVVTQIEGSEIGGVTDIRVILNFNTEMERIASRN